ncbi:hypothetical protein [Bacillus thuringiensis]|uniref:Uncharacterized protein n=1 Tax=Bacillus thuringiensis TaxID=1428 RepID=A0A4Y8T487_BACTU|nr:hypothetical protein [Bacillus thuringiensis]TFF45770.1 hypothetical protein EQ803_16010 [Bacillus thuringiensis]
MKPVQMYLGAPQQTKLPVYEVQSNQQATVKQIVLSNTDTADSKITVTVNTVDIMKDLIVASGETKIIDTTIVLNQNDRLSLQQEKTNAINVMINGMIEPMMGY